MILNTYVLKSFEYSKNKYIGTRQFITYLLVLIQLYLGGGVNSHYQINAAFVKNGN